MSIFRSALLDLYVVRGFLLHLLRRLVLPGTSAHKVAMFKLNATSVLIIVKQDKQAAQHAQLVNFVKILA